MEIPETFLHKGIDQHQRHDKPGKLGNTVRISRTNDDDPEGVTD